MCSTCKLKKIKKIKICLKVILHQFWVKNFFFINWTLRMSDNLPERVQILDHAHIIGITVRENRIICGQIFCDLLLKSAFERIVYVMQLIIVTLKWHSMWKYSIQKFHDICLSYYFKWIKFWKNPIDIVNIFYMWMLCITLTERNTTRFVQNRHLPKSPSTEWLWCFFIELVMFFLFAMQFDYCNIQRVFDQK